MPICPKGHDSASADYCDECGTPIEAMIMAVPVPEVTADPTMPAPVVASPGPEYDGYGMPCPTCQTPRAGRFCEVCGHDFATQNIPSTVQPGAPPPLPDAEPGTWRAVASADRAFYDRMRDVMGLEVDEIPFPPYCPERRFPLDAGEVLIGRYSRSRGIDPQIDLTGPPLDPAVSHTHAVLQRQPDGEWTVTDLRSGNGTFLNDATDPLPAYQATKITAGDRIHLGAWTTLVIRCD